MFRWLNGPGAVFRHALPGSTNYINAYDRSGNLLRAIDSSALGKNQQDEDEENGAEADDEEAEEGEFKATRKEKARKPPRKETTEGTPLPKENLEDLMPFPLNRQFRSQPVLSEELKDEIWKRIMEEGKSIRDVSATLGVEMNRVGAVVRLKGVEREWEKQGKPLATPYARAVLGMLPQTPYIANDPVVHESINDLPVHRATQIQIFHPVSESKHFTRRDAGKVFDRTLLPAEDRVPHKELVQLEKWKRENMVPSERVSKMRAMNEEEVRKRKEADRKRLEREAKEVRKAETERYQFRFQDIKVESVGWDGRDRKGVGARYGVPHQDRKKGQIKIPTRVD